MNLKELPAIGKSNSFNYSEFLELVKSHVQNKSTTGKEQTERLIGFTSLNLHRMERLNKTFQPTEDSKTIIGNIQKQIWVIITEAWCGDSAQNLPVLAKLAELNPENIDLKIVLRDENIAWMNYYHTEGRHSIPKLIIFDENGDEICTWGPRPSGGQDIFNEWKSTSPETPKDDMEVKLHTWYARDRGLSTEQEITSCLEEMVS